MLFCQTNICLSAYLVPLSFKKKYKSLTNWLLRFIHVLYRRAKSAPLIQKYFLLCLLCTLLFFASILRFPLINLFYYLNMRAPLFNRRKIILSWPFSAAKCRGVIPFSSASLRSRASCTNLRSLSQVL